MSLSKLAHVLTNIYGSTKRQISKRFTLIILYSIEAIPPKLRNIKSIELDISRVFLKIFNACPVDVINYCKLFVGFEPAHEIICIQVEYCSANNLICRAISIIIYNVNLSIFLICFEAGFVVSIAWFPRIRHRIQHPDF